MLQYILYSGKGHDLDPKQVQGAFNLKTVIEHFEQIAKIIMKFNILPENLYNWDEKGTQLGRGSKGL